MKTLWIAFALLLVQSGNNVRGWRGMRKTGIIETLVLSGSFGYINCSDQGPNSREKFWPEKWL